jgi:hypothetical protein
VFVWWINMAAAGTELLIHFVGSGRFFCDDNFSDWWYFVNAVINVLKLTMIGFGGNGGEEHTYLTF